MPVKGLWCNATNITIVTKKIDRQKNQTITPETRFFGADIGRKNIVVMTEIVPEDRKSKQDPKRQESKAKPKKRKRKRKRQGKRKQQDLHSKDNHEKSKSKKQKSQHPQEKQPDPKDPKRQFWTFNGAEIRRAKKTPKHMQHRILQKLYSGKAKEFLKTFKIESGKICIVFGEYLSFFFCFISFLVITILVFSKSLGDWHGSLEPIEKFKKALTCFSKIECLFHTISEYGTTKSVSTIFFIFFELKY